ncbi:MAG TPA: hypothetical protein VJK09_03300 [Candidatus Paceibacterota bacterium]
MSEANNNKIRIGFIGQGWIGKNYADYFERRNFKVVRYALEEPYRKNKEKIKDCDIVFIAVPTPTTPEGFDDSIVRNAVALVGANNIAVIKSTVLPGTTKRVQEKYPDRYVMHCPEFLTEVTVIEDVAHPFHNIIGVPEMTDILRTKAELVMSILPRVKSEIICLSQEAELFKYMRNNYLYTKYMFMNIYYDVASAIGADWNTMQAIMINDPWIGSQGLTPVHKGGRGAGGHCHIKDLAALRVFAEKIMPENKEDIAVLKSLEHLNKKLLKESGKDLDLLEGVYGKI